MEKTTRTGRVVYNRPRHFFSVKDLARVSRSVPPPASVEEGLYALATVGGILIDVTRSVYYVIGLEIDAGFFLRKWKSIMIQGINALAVLPIDSFSREKLMQVADILGSL